MLLAKSEERFFYLEIQAKAVLFAGLDEIDQLGNASSRKRGVEPRPRVQQLNLSRVQVGEESLSVAA